MKIIKYADIIQYANKPSEFVVLLCFFFDEIFVRLMAFCLLMQGANSMFGSRFKDINLKGICLVASPR